MTHLELIENYKEYCLANGLKPPLIPRMYDEKQVLGDIYSNLYAQAARIGKQKCREEVENGFFY